jgi:2-polyprenyl-6-methoxyphenol hydroxylase-like FAD-dependent oxidoreductase
MQYSVLVVGGGLAGLSAATALAAHGHAVDLVDTGDSADGASIGISARAVDALAELGVLAEAEASANVARTPVFDRQFDADGDRLPLPPMPPIPPRPDGRPAMVTIYRPTLAEILERAAQEAGVDVRRPATLEAFEERDDGVHARRTDGEARYDLVVVADGVRSTLRKRLLPDVEPEYTGLMSLRAVIPDVPPGQAGFYHGAGATLIVGLLPGDRTYLASGTVMPNEHVDEARARGLLADVLARFPAPYPRLLLDRLDDAPTVIARPYETVYVPEPVLGRFVVIGDAAHATTPNLSSGGGMALEDGVVLAQELTAAASLPQGLQAFTDRRRDRVRLVYETSVRLMELEDLPDRQQDAARMRGAALGTLARPY